MIVVFRAVPREYEQSVIVHKPKYARIELVKETFETVSSYIDLRLRQLNAYGIHHVHFYAAAEVVEEEVLESQLWRLADVKTSGSGGWLKLSYEVEQMLKDVCPHNLDKYDDLITAVYRLPSSKFKDAFINLMQSRPELQSGRDCMIMPYELLYNKLG